MLSTLFTFLCIDQTALALLLLFLYLLATRLFNLQLKVLHSILISLLLLRCVFLNEWGVLTQIAFVFAFNKWKLTPRLFLYYITGWVLTLWIPVDPIFVVKWVLYPLSGALAISFLFGAKSGKEHLISFLLYFMNGLWICFLFKNIEVTFYFITLNLFLVSIISLITLIKINNKKKPISAFPQEIHIVLMKNKEIYLLQFFAIIVFLSNMYQQNEHSWMVDWALSIILQVEFLKIFSVIMKDAPVETKGNSSDVPDSLSKKK